MGAITFTASKPVYHRDFYPLMSGVVHAPFPDPYHPILQSLPGEDYGATVVRYIEEQILEHILPSGGSGGSPGGANPGGRRLYRACTGFFRLYAACATGTRSCLLLMRFSLEWAALANGGRLSILG